MSDLFPPHSSSTDSPDVNDQACQTRVMLWCTPRSTSSIFTKCLSAVSDSQVYFEPYSFCQEAIFWLESMGKNVNPTSTSGYDDVTTNEWLETAKLISGEDCEGRLNIEMMKFPRIKRELKSPDPSHKFIFLKESAGSINGFYNFLPDKACNYKYVFLLRNPIRVFSSWRKVIYELHKSLLQGLPNAAHSTRLTSFDNFHLLHDTPDVYTPRGLFFQEIYDLWKYVRENLDPSPVIIDSDDLLSDPATMLRRFCSAVGIPYTDDLLRWDGNPDSTKEWISAFAPPNDFEFIRVYCRTSFNSTHFLPPTPLPAEDSLTQDVRECVERTMPYYQEMYENRI